VPLRHEAEGPICAACSTAPLFGQVPGDASAAGGSAEIPAPGTEVGGLVVRRRLDDGAMGQIVLAHDPGLDRDVVLKFLHGRLMGDQRAELRFVREGRALAGVDHANVVKVYGVGRWRHRPYLAMEYVEGTPLSRAIRSGRMAVDDALRVAEDLAAALAAIHAQRIVHGDVKPANVVLRHRDGSACLIDFGLARPLTISEPDAMAGGTPLYMAPEQIGGRRADTRADVYSFGVTLYEMLTGAVPHEEHSSAAFFHSVLHRDAPLVSRLRPEVPRAVEVLLGRALARARELRQPDGRALLAEVRAMRLGRTPADEGTSVVREPTTTELAPPQDPAEDLPLCGRDAEYADAMQALCRTPEGRGSVVIVEGRPGAGKSRFLRDLGRGARARGLAVLACAGSEGRGTPLGALRGALLEHARAVGADGPEAAVELLRRTSPDDEPLAPALRRVLAPGPHDDVRDDKATVMRAALALFRTAAADRPAVLTIDDLHLLDEGSLDVVVALADEAASMPFSVAACTRAGEQLAPDAPLASRLPRLRAAPGAIAIELAPLTVGAVAAMIHHALRLGESEACRLAPLLHRRASGNPLYLVESLRLLDQEGHVEDVAGGRTFRERVSTMQIPPLLMELALRRIAGLPAEERDTLGVVSIDPDGVNADLVAACRDVSKLAALRVLQQLVAGRGLVRQQDDRYLVAHAEIREAVYGELIEELRAEYHALAARDARERGATPARLGRHLRLAGRHDEAVAPLLAAGRALVSGYSPAEAVDVLDEAIACAGPAGCPAAELERARALEMLGELPRAREELTRLAQASGEEGLGALVELVRFEGNRGHDTEALRLLARASRLEGPPELRSRVLIQEAELASRAGREHEAFGALAKCEALADRLAPRDLLQHWVNETAVHFRFDHMDEAMRWAERALAKAEELGVAQIAAMCMHNLSLICDELGDGTAALAWAERAVERAALVGADREHVFALSNLTMLLTDALRLEEAEAALARLAIGVDRLDSDEARYNACARDAELAIARGSCDRALAAVNRGVDLAAAHPRNSAIFHTMRSHALLGLARAAEALEEARGARAKLVELGADADAEEALACAARALRMLGRGDAERAELRGLVDVQTFEAAIERVHDARGEAERDSRLARAAELARNPRSRRELKLVSIRPARS
jgi:tetratricopeptide (TPR) repeat protein